MLRQERKIALERAHAQKTLNGAVEAYLYPNTSVSFYRASSLMKSLSLQSKRQLKLQGESLLKRKRRFRDAVRSLLLL